MRGHSNGCDVGVRGIYGIHIRPNRGVGCGGGGGGSYWMLDMDNDGDCKGRRRGVSHNISL